MHQAILRVCAASVVLTLLFGVRPASSQDGDVDPVLIDKFETFKSAQSKGGIPEFLPRPSATERAIYAALDMTTEVTFRDNDLGTALDYLKETHGIEIWVDKVRVNVQDYTVTLESSKASFRSCLNLILEPHALCYVVEDDVLKITTQEAADTKMITRTYPAGDLFSNPEEAEELTAVLECGLGLNPNVEGPRPLKISTKSRAIVLRQTHRVHDQLLQLLRDLRQAPADTTSAAADLVLRPSN